MDFTDGITTERSPGASMRTDCSERLIHELGSSSESHGCGALASNLSQQ